MKNYTLLVMAAGMGSRYGGLKQFDYMSEDNDILMDFSIRDAIDVGFNKIVFVIREMFKEEFIALQSEKLKNENVSLHYVCQEIDDIPDGYQIDANRQKPWGTGHAVLVAKDIINEPFIVINADDFYGKKSFESVFQHLKKLDVNSHQMCMVGYFLKNTVSDNGYVSRGECFVNDDGHLEGVVERTHIEKTTDGIIRKDDQGNQTKMNIDAMVSMNFWGFTPKFFEALEKEFHHFLTDSSKELKSEFFMPSVVNTLLQSDTGNVKVITCDARWMGVTYGDDKQKVWDAVAKMKVAGTYPKKLWK